jgi:hypothetical protein
MTCSAWRLPEPEEARIAEEQCSRAIGLFVGGPADQRNLADEALAHVYLGTARVTLGDLDGVLEAIRPVLDIPPDQRISWQRKRLARLRDMIDVQRFRHSPLVAAVREEISAFTKLLRPTPLPTGPDHRLPAPAAGCPRPKGGCEYYWKGLVAPPLRPTSISEDPLL